MKKEKNWKKLASLYMKEEETEGEGVEEKEGKMVERKRTEATIKQGEKALHPHLRTTL